MGALRRSYTRRDAPKCRKSVFQPSAFAMDFGTHGGHRLLIPGRQTVKTDTVRIADHAPGIQRATSVHREFFVNLIAAG